MTGYTSATAQYSGVYERRIDNRTYTHAIMIHHADFELFKTVMYCMLTDYSYTRLIEVIIYLISSFPCLYGYQVFIGGKYSEAHDSIKD